MELSKCLNCFLKSHNKQLNQYCTHLDSTFPLNPALCFSPFFFFFFLLSRILGRRQTSLFTRQISLFTHYSGTVHVLFMGPTSTLLKKIKNESHNTIHTFKNYFVIVFSVFSFSNNKFNPNGPNIVFILFYFFTQKKS